MGTSSFSVRSRALDLEPADLGVEEVAQAVTEEVQAEDRDHDGGTRIEHEPGRLLQVETPLGQDVAPRRDIGWDAHTEEAQRRLRQHRRREYEAPLHDHW